MRVGATMGQGSAREHVPALGTVLSTVTKHLNRQLQRKRANLAQSLRTQSAMAGRLAAGEVDAGVYPALSFAASQGPIPKDGAAHR